MTRIVKCKTIKCRRTVELLPQFSEQYCHECSLRELKTIDLDKCEFSITVRSATRKHDIIPIKE